MTFVVGALVVGVGCAGGGPSAPVTFDTRLVVATLASDEFEGRLTGSEGIRGAGEYIVALLNLIGAEPLPDQTDFLLPFEFTAGVSDGGTTLNVAGGSEEPRSWGEGAVQALSFSKNGSVTGPLVFAGYGLSVPETDDFSYDSYATLDVTGKVALVLRYFPEDTEGGLRGTLSRYAGLRYKALAARERGAVGLIVVAGPRSPNAGTLVPMTFDTALSGSNVVAASITGAVGEALVARTGKTLEGVQAALDTGNPHVTGFEIPDTEVTVSVSVNREQRTGHNIVGYLPPSDVADIVKPHVMLGGHYDHLGYGTGGNSLARDDEAGEIHNGADDNASGVAAILSAGAQLAATERQRGIILAFWSGEELGLLGSGDFVQTAPVAMDQIAAYLNFDMVGRLTDNRLSVQAVGSSSIWTELVNELNEPFGVRPAIRRGSVSAHRCHEPQSGRGAECRVFHRKPRGLPPADRRSRDRELHRPRPDRRVGCNARGSTRNRWSTHRTSSRPSRRYSGTDEVRSESSPAPSPTMPRRRKVSCCPVWSVEDRRRRPGCRVATSSSSSRVRRSQTSTTTPTLWIS